MVAKYKVLALGDVHAPFHSKECISYIFDKVEQIKPNLIIQLGDMLDLLSFSRFPKVPLHKMSPQDEILEGVQVAAEIWEVLGKKCPNAKRIQLIGNHDNRLTKSIIEKAPEFAAFVDVKKILDFPGVETIGSYKDFIVIDGVAYHHGFKSKPMEHARHFEKSAVVGHTHRSWTQWEPINGRLCFDSSIGYLADPLQEALKYRETNVHKWVHGFQIIDRGMPKFYPINVPKYEYKPLKVE